MNIEEQSIGNAIRTAGNLPGHFHTGECNRMIPGQGRTVGSDIKVWRDIVEDTSEEALDRDAAEAVRFQRFMLDR